MAKTRHLPKPTAGELNILRVLWRIGPATVRQVHDELSQEQKVGYTTVLKLLQIMTDKGLVTRDDTERSHVYEAALVEERTQRQLVADLLDRAFGGSAQKLVVQALSVKKASREELAEIRRMLDELSAER